MRRAGLEAESIPPTGTKTPDLDIKIKGLRLSLGKRTYIMGVLNVTPDSFSERGEFFDRDRAVARAVEMASEGADIIDVGGESTRPGAEEISLGEELDRVIPVIEAVAKEVDLPISIDTRKSKVALEAVRLGAAIVNDISGLRHDPGMPALVAKYGVALIVMHMKGSPRDMQLDPVYEDLMGEVIEGLRGSIEIAKRSGISEGNIIIDPGIGFGKTLEHNLKILNNLSDLKVLGRPVCIGTSRKSFIGKVLGIDDPKERLAGTLAACAVSIMKGANILRVHDVKEVSQAARLVDSVLKERVN